MTPRQFKETFKVGDTVSGWATGKQVTITAIGITRFLAWDLVRVKECVCTMNMDWKLIKESKDVKP